MTPALTQREVALAGVALLAAVVALAVTSPRGSNSGGHLKPVFVPGGGWYTALAGAQPVRYGTRTNCGVMLRPTTRGVVDSVLPCNIKLFVSFGGSPRILTQIVARRPVVPGRRFDVTPGLAEDLGIQGIQRIKWVYAR
ncbi:MAG: hypothetical protein E6F94_04130 [Actinobacteria bacterium]|nr:MAG: hypothetical protein E6G38_08415 [Actinomycetota bacterium]TMM27160.1 MAG: hypothetical protein E6F94_04130 [Actinomycetota bacterium]